MNTKRIIIIMLISLVLGVLTSSVVLEMILGEEGPLIVLIAGALGYLIWFIIINVTIYLSTKQ